LIRMKYKMDLNEIMYDFSQNLDEIKLWWIYYY
jgi:hypothetical protein